MTFQSAVCMCRKVCVCLCVHTSCQHPWVTLQPTSPALPSQPTPPIASSGQADLARSQQKVDSLQKLARSLTADNKLLADEATRLRHHTDSVSDLLKVNPLLEAADSNCAAIIPAQFSSGPAYVCGWRPPVWASVCASILHNPQPHNQQQYLPYNQHVLVFGQQLVCCAALLLIIRARSTPPGPSIVCVCMYAHTCMCVLHLQGIQERVDDQQQETHKVLEQNKALLSENALLQAQLTSTKELLEELRTTQQQRISGLADQLQQQVCRLCSLGQCLPIYHGWVGSRPQRGHIFPTNTCVQGSLSWQ